MLGMERKGRQGCRSRFAWFLTIILGVGLATALLILPGVRELVAPSPGPPRVTLPPYTPWPTPPVAERFDFPLHPIEDYAPYARGITGPRAIDTRYGVQNPALGDRANCFRDCASAPVPFSELYHAGVDLFARGPLGTFLWGAAASDPVHAVAHGVVAATLDAGAEGQILITEHRRADDSSASRRASLCTEARSSA